MRHAGLLLLLSGVGLPSASASEPVRPSFSADGTGIVFNRDYPDGRVEIHEVAFASRSQVSADPLAR